MRRRTFRAALGAIALALATLVILQASRGRGGPPPREDEGAREPGAAAATPRVEEPAGARAADTVPMRAAEGPEPPSERAAERPPMDAPAPPSPPPLDPPPTGRIEGRVLDPVGRSVAGALVEWVVGTLKGDTDAGPEGLFAFDRVPVGEVFLRAFAPTPPSGSWHSVARAARVPRPGETVVADLTLPPSCHVVFEMNPPAALREVGLLGPMDDRHWAPEERGVTATFDSELAVGLYLAWFIGEAGQGPLWALVRFEAAPGGMRVPVALASMGWIRGTVQDPSGHGVPDMVVALPCDADMVEAWNRSVVRGGWSGEDGRFECGALPAGRWRVVVAGSDPFASAERIVDVAAGTATEVSIALPYDRTVLVRSPEDLTYWLAYAEGPPSLRGGTRDGRTIEICGLGPGDRALFLAVDDRARRVGWCEIGPGDLEAVLDVGGWTSIEGVVRDATGEPAGAGVEVALRYLSGIQPPEATDPFAYVRRRWPFELPTASTEWTTADGRFQAFAFPGEWEVGVVGGEPRRVRVALGETVEVELVEPE